MSIPPSQYAVHMSHCAQGEHEGCCKYGQDDECPAVAEAESNVLRAAKLIEYAFQGHDTVHSLHSYSGEKGHLALMMKVRHMGGEHASVVEYEVHRDGVMIDFSAALVEMVARFNSELVTMKLL